MNTYILRICLLRIPCKLYNYSLQGAKIWMFSIFYHKKKLVKNSYLDIFRCTCTVTEDVLWLFWTNMLDSDLTTACSRFDYIERINNIFKQDPHVFRLLRITGNSCLSFDQFIVLRKVSIFLLDLSPWIDVIFNIYHSLAYL